MGRKEENLLILVERRIDKTNFRPRKRATGSRGLAWGPHAMKPGSTMRKPQ